MQAIGDAGLFSMWLPRALGRPELAPIAFLKVIEELSRQDASGRLVHRDRRRPRPLCWPTSSTNSLRDLRLRSHHPGWYAEPGRHGGGYSRGLSRHRPLEIRQRHRPQPMGIWVWQLRHPRRCRSAPYPGRHAAAAQHSLVSEHSNLEPIGRVLSGLSPGTARF